MVLLVGPQREHRRQPMEYLLSLHHRPGCGSVLLPPMGQIFAVYWGLIGRTSPLRTHTWRNISRCCQRTLEGIWHFLSGRGEMWRWLGCQEEPMPVEPGVAVTIPVGTRFQRRSFGCEPSGAVGVTMTP